MDDPVELMSSRSFDTKRDLGKPLLRRLQRARAVLILARVARIPGRRKLADSMWRSFLEAYGESLYDTAPKEVIGIGNGSCRSWWELKYWTFIASCFEQHGIYEQLLSAYDEVFPRSRGDGDACFFGSGHGRSTLNTYRLLRFSIGRGGERSGFEKVYNSECDDYSRVRFLEAAAAEPLRSAGVLFPNVLDALVGPRITITYSEVLGGRRLTERAALRRSADVVRVLMEVPVTPLPAGAAVGDYHANIVEAFSNAREWLLLRKPGWCAAYDGVFARVQAEYPRFLAHGDLHRKNMLSSGAVLDWDNAGLYPIGFDPGMILSKSVKGGTVEELEGTIRAHFLRGAAKDHPALLVHGALFFGFVFGAGKKSSMPESLLLAMIETILKSTPETS